jgi:AAA domain-containing protein
LADPHGREDHEEAAERGEPHAGSVRDSLLGRVIAGACKALADEVDAARSDPGRNFEVTHGRWLHSGEKRHLYLFRTAAALPIPPETPLHLGPGGDRWIRGSLVAAEEFEILLELHESLGPAVPRAQVSAEPWFIHEALKKKLEAEQERGLEEDLRIPAALLGLDGPTLEEDAPQVAGTGTPPEPEGRRHLVPNPSQAAALARAADRRFHFVWGPPGTGKTATLARAVRLLAARGERVLLLAHSNAAVDAAILETLDALAGSPDIAAGRVLRIGSPHLPEVRGRPEILPDGVLERQQPELIARKRLVDAEIERLFALLRSHAASATDASDLDEMRKQRAAVEKEVSEALAALLAEARVVAATLSKMAVFDLLYNWPADAILIDETSMASFPGVLAAALRARRRLLLFGDFRQLPPIALATTPSAKEWLERDAFQIAGVRDRIDAQELEPRVTLLDIQYRMAPPAGDLVSELAYQGRVHNAPHLAEALSGLASRPPCAGKVVVLLDTSLLRPACFREPRLGSRSRVNPVQALLTGALVRQAVRHGWHSVGAVTPYRAQARLVDRTLRSWEPPRDVTAATVHRFQGAERDLVIFDLVDAAPEPGASLLTGTDEEMSLRLINVAVSRTRGKLIVLADADFVRERHPRTSPARRLLELLERHGSVLRPDVPALQAELDEPERLWATDWTAVQPVLARELQAARTCVSLHLPPGFEPSADLVEAADRAAGLGARVQVFAPFDLARRFEATRAELRLMSRPGGFFALLDGSTAYIGGLAAGGAFTRVAEAPVVELLEEMLLGPPEEIRLVHAAGGADVSVLTGHDATSPVSGACLPWPS